MMRKWMKRMLSALLVLVVMLGGSISAFAATSGEIKAEEDRLKALIGSLDSEKITKITIEQFRPGQGLVASESDSEEAISVWVNLFKRMEITGVEYEALYGAFGTVYIHDERGKVRVCVHS